MPVIIDDAFYDDLGDGLPARSLSLLLPAASWSARRSKSGFVPAWMVAKLSDDPDRDMGPLQAVGIARRVKGGGMQIAEGKGITIVNADAATAEAERKREQGRIRSQRKRDRDKAARTAAMQDGVTSASRGQKQNVTRTERAEDKKPQVGGESVTRYEAGSSRVTAEIDASDDQDLYQDQSLGIDGSKSDAQAREDADLAIAVADAVCAKYGFTPDGAQVRNGIAAIEERARKAGTTINSRIKYIPGAAAKDRKLWKAPAAPGPSPEPAATPPPHPGPPVAVALADWNPSRSHEFRETYPRSGVCECGATKRNPKHPQEQVMVPSCTA